MTSIIVNSVRANAAKILMPVCGLLCLFPFISSAIALIGGMVIALSVGNPYAAQTRKLIAKCLSIAVVGLGAGMNLTVIGKVGAHGIIYTVVGIGLSCIPGTVIGRMLKVERDTSLLITIGTAICGGSAIAAVAPVIRAKEHEISVALSIVFLLNALALLIFPPIGHVLGLSQYQFGLWSALAIHDTSSVIGASLQYGPQALETGTTVKLARALWIIPVAFAVGFYRARRHKVDEPVNLAATGKAKRPWFILGFLLAAALVTFFPVLQPAGYVVESVAKRLLVITLFLIGAGLTRQTLRRVGLAPFLQGAILWIIVASTTLGAIWLDVIR